MTIAQLMFYAQALKTAESVPVGLNRGEAIELAKHKHQQREAELSRLQETMFDEP